MRPTTAVFVLVAFLGASLPSIPFRSAVAAEVDGGAIHGEVRTRDGRSLRGAIEWGDHAWFWDQALPGVYDQALEIGERTENVQLFGLKLWEWQRKQVLELSLNVPFGHIERLERVDKKRARLVLRDGSEVGIRSESGDFGSADGEIRVETDDGRQDLRWDDIERVTFVASPGPDPRAARRLYGTVTTADRSFTGFVAWDRDETMIDEILDGDDDEVPFRDIAEIHRDGERAARVVLQDGGDVRLSGTNDVDRSNRGIEVRGESFGSVIVDWEAFVAFRLADPPPSAARGTFAGGPIRGTVVTVDGAVHRGAILWGDHERFAWEAIDGEISPGIRVAIPFSLVRSVAPLPGGGATVVGFDGATRTVYGDDTSLEARPLEVRGSGPAVRVPWIEVARVEFDTGR